MKISQKIAAGFLATLTMAAALALYADLANRRSMEEAVGHEALVLARETMNDIDSTIHDRLHNLRIGAGHSSILEQIACSNRSFAQLGSPQDFMDRMERQWQAAPPLRREIADNALSRQLRRQFNSLFQLQYGYSPFPDVLMTNRYGALVAATGWADAYRCDREPWWRTARDQGLYLEDIAYHAAADCSGIVVALRLDDDNGNFAGVIRAIIDVGPLVRNAGITGRYQTARTRLLTRDGKIIYRSRPYRFLQDFSATELFNRLQAEEGFFITEEGSQQVQRLYCYARSGGDGQYPGFGWILLVSYDADEVLAEANAQRTRTIAVSLLLIAAGMAFALWQSRTINRSLDELALGAGRIGSGDLDFRMKLNGEDEFGQLAAAFNRMAENLKQITASRDELHAEMAERSKAEKALAQSEERFRATFEQAAVGIALVSPQGNWLRVNSTMCEIVGYPEDQLLQLTFQDITYGDDLERSLAYCRQLLAGAISTYSLEKRYSRPDRSLVWVYLTVSLVRDEAGCPAYFIGVIEDIDQRKRAEQERDRLSLELSQKNQELEQIIYVTSHDLRSPLVNVQGFSRELAADTQALLALWQDAGIPEPIRRQAGSLLNEDIPEALRFIETGVARMDALLSGLLRLSRLGRASLTLEECDMNRLLADIMVASHYQITESGASVEVGELPACRGDRSQLNQLFSNLLENALKYLEPARPGRIRISGKRQDGESVYCVADNGIGIAREHQGKIFEIFHRLNPAAGQGDGLGLTIVTRILDRLDGRIWVESEEGKGSNFYVSLPVWTGKAASAPQPHP